MFFSAKFFLYWVSTSFVKYVLLLLLQTILLQCHESQKNFNHTLK